MPIRHPSRCRVSRGEYFDRLVFYPRLDGQGARGGSQPTDGTPVAEVPGSLQVEELSSRPQGEAQDATRRRGRIRALIALPGPPPVDVVPGTRVDHVGGGATTFDAPDTYRVIGLPIPPGGLRARWSIAAERDT